MTILFERFLAPALVAAFVAFFVNNAIYHRRQKRSYRNDLLDSVRAYIKAGVEMAVAYFSESDVEKRVNAASQLQLFESDLRSVPMKMATIRRSSPTLSYESRTSSLISLAVPSGLNPMQRAIENRSGR